MLRFLGRRRSRTRARPRRGHHRRPGAVRRSDHARPDGTRAEGDPAAREHRLHERRLPRGRPAAQYREGPDRTPRHSSEVARRDRRRVHRATQEGGVDQGAGDTLSSGTAAAIEGAHEQKAFSLPAGATEVIVVRHGASEMALPGAPFPLLDGRGDPTLSDAGLEQARAIAERLAPEGVARRFGRPLRRTPQTAAPLADATRLDPIVVEELAEVRLGDWEGGEYRLRVARGDPLVREMFEKERWDVIPGAESPESLGGRVRAGIERIVELTGPDAIAVAFLHGGVIGEVFRLATDSRP